MLIKLRKRFVTLTTIISFTVLFIIVITLNTTIYTTTIKDADRLSNLIIDSGFKLNPEYRPHPDEFEREIAFTARFFTIDINNNNKIIDMNLENIKFVTKEEVEALLNKVISNNDKQGLISNFRYRVIDYKNGSKILFLDLERPLDIYKTTVSYSIIVALLALIVILILAWFFSKRAVLPIVESVEKQKRFITDVSHELKTPLAIINANTEIIELESGEGELTDTIKGQVRTLNVLINRLISLSKLEEADINMKKEKFSLSDLIDESLLEFHSSMQSKSLNLVTDISNDIAYLGNEDEIRKIITILIENSIKYSKENGEISVILTGKKPVIIIKNSCDNIKKGNYNKWFDRFYRDDLSRSTNGYGIGLSIAKAICDKQGIKSSIYSNDGEHIVVKLEF